jgi:hypothetical protein
MKRAPKIAVTVALLSMVWGTASLRGVYAADAPSATTTAPAGGSDANTAGMTPAEVIRAATTTTMLSNANNEPPSLDQRIAAFDNRLSNVQSEGRLSAEEADNYRNTLARVMEDEAKSLASVGKLNSFEEQKLNLTLDRLDRDFFTHLHDRKVAIPDIPARLLEIQRGVAVASSEGRLTPQATQQLTTELKAWHEKESALMRDAQLSYTDSLILSMHIDRIIDQIARTLQPRPATSPDLKLLVAQAEKATANGDSKISPEALSAMKKRLDADKTAIASLAGMQNAWVRLGQTLAVAGDLQQIVDRAELLASGKAAPKPFAERAVEIDQMISSGLSHGILTANEAHELKAELEGILAEQKASGDSALVVADQPPRVAVELERLSGQVTRKEHAPRLPWTGIAAFHTALDQHIEDAYKFKRITLEQARQFKKTSDELAAQEKDYTSSGNRMDAAEALEIAIQLQRVGVDLHHAMKDRNVKAPDLNVLQSQLDKLIAEGIESGRLEVNDNLTNRIARIASLREQYEKSPEGLDERAKLAIGTAIQHLIGQIQSQVHRDNLHAPQSLDARLSQLAIDINTSMSRGILTMQRAAQYKAALDTVQAELWSDRKKGGGMTVPDSLAAANDVSVLEEQLSDELRENSSLPRQLIPRYRGLVLDIGQAVAAGRISPEDADALMKELNTTAWSHVEAAGSQGGLSHGEGLRLALDLERISTELESKLRDEPIPMPNISNKALHLDSALANALVTGKLSVPEAQQLEQKLEGVLAASAVFSSTGGGISHVEALTVSLELDQLNREVDQVQRGSAKGPDISARQADLLKRIKAATINGKLTAKDADSLRYDLDRIADSEEAFRVSDEGLNFAEALTLATNLDRVASRFQSLSKGQAVTKR